MYLMKNQVNKQEATAIVAETAGKVKCFEQSFDALKRAAEAALVSGDATPVYDLAEIGVKSVLKFVLDPQRAAAVKRDMVSDSGCSSGTWDLCRDMYSDFKIMSTQDTQTALEETETLLATVKKSLKDARAAWRKNKTAANARRVEDTMLEVSALERKAETNKRKLEKLVTETYSDSMDLVQTWVEKLYSLAAEYGPVVSGWLDKEITITSTREWTTDGTPKHKTVTKTPWGWCNNAVRQAIRAMGTISPSLSKWAYVDDYAASLLLRVPANIGGYVDKYSDIHGVSGAPHGIPQSALFGCTYDDAERCAEIVDKMGTTQAENITLEHLQDGWSKVQIAAKMGVREETVYKYVSRLQEKAVAAGLAPAEWLDKDMNAEKAKVVQQWTLSGELVATYGSVGAAAKSTGVRKGNISNCVNGRQGTAGGYKWTAR